jgi:DnaJ-class molecular chaperone
MPSNRLVKCTTCKGTGEDPDYPKAPYSKPCTDCNGSGTIESEINLTVHVETHPQDEHSYYRRHRHDVYITVTTQGSCAVKACRSFSVRSIADCYG